MHDIKQFLQRKKNVLIPIFLLLPIFVTLYTTFISPRPYYIYSGDAEPDYYYNAKLIHSGQKIDSMHHPGIPAMYLLAFIMKIVGASVDKTQFVFNVSYL
tara:strand:+ start:198 stop:497 length:300 start_codon:yes stop_codon:yes gene_type:complete